MKLAGPRQTFIIIESFSIFLFPDSSYKSFIKKKKICNNTIHGTFHEKPGNNDDGLKGKSDDFLEEPLALK